MEILVTLVFSLTDSVNEEQQKELIKNILTGIKRESINYGIMPENTDASIQKIDVTSGGICFNISDRHLNFI